jgi:small subunit ribosomal protein S6
MATATATAQQPRWAHDYETIYILRPNTEPDEADKVAQRVGEVIERLEGKLVKVDNWGKRKLAYPIKKFTRGVFVYVRYVGYSDVVAELERNLRMLDPVVRYQTVRIAQNVVAAEYTVDPEEVKFLRIEVTEDEEEPDLEQQLGLVGRSGGYGDDEGAPREAEEGGDEDEEERAEQRPAAAPSEEEE